MASRPAPTTDRGPDAPATTAPERGRRLSPEARREQLVAVGLELLQSTPFDQISTEDVARRAGISHALVFHYFPTRRDLEAAVLRAAATRLFDELVARPEVSFEEQLGAGLEAFVDFIEAHPGSYVALVRSSGTDPQLLEVFEETRRDIVQFIAERLGIDDPPVAMRIAIRGWIAMVEETTLDWLDTRAFPRELLTGYLERAAFTLLPLALDLVEQAAPDV